MDYQVDGLHTLLKYAGCALGIAGANNPAGVIGAIIACANLLYETADDLGRGNS
jgi:hypothetical protein